MIRPVIPGATRQAHPEPPAPALRRPLPLPAIPTPPARRTHNTVYRTAVIDNRGRFTHRVALRHAELRGGGADRQLLRYSDGTPITTRRYDHLWARIGHHLPWVAIQGISTHWLRLRHTTLTWVERNFGYAVARAYAGHNDNTSDAGTTATYLRATLEEVPTALAALTGEPHPLAIAA